MEVLKILSTQLFRGQKRIPTTECLWFGPIGRLVSSKCPEDVAYKLSQNGDIDTEAKISTVASSLEPRAHCTHKISEKAAQPLCVCFSKLLLHVKTVLSQIGLPHILDVWMSPHEQHGDMFFFCRLLRWSLWPPYAPIGWNSFHP